MDDNTAHLFTAGAACVAALTFIYSVWKARADIRRSREVSARAAWEQYLEMAFDNPGLARADLTGDLDQFEQYEWFVSRMLYAAEEVLLLSTDDRNWAGVIRTQISFHSCYLNEQGRPYIDHYSAPLRRLLNEELGFNA